MLGEPPQTPPSASRNNPQFLAQLSHFGPKNRIILQIRPKVSTTNHP